MNCSQEKMKEFVHLLKRHAPTDGLHETGIPDFAAFRESEPHERRPVVYVPGIAILGQGKKYCYLDGKKYDFSAGNYLGLFLPMPFEVEVIGASEEEPLLMAGVRIDLTRVADILVKMDRAGSSPASAKDLNPSAIVTEPLNDDLLDPILKLMNALENPVELEVLGDAILDEIHFRLICNDRTGSLHELLRHRGQVQQIFRAVNHIHSHIDQMVSVEELASMVNMSTSGFRKTFRNVMHMPPLQYAKAVKLDRAQALIREGKNAGEAAYLVGYNSSAQFSREYKRQFGYSPSATRTAALGSSAELPTVV